jgi:hypothetical protein
MIGSPAVDPKSLQPTSQLDAGDAFGSASNVGIRPGTAAPFPSF